MEDHFSKLFDNYIKIVDCNLKLSNITLKYFLDSYIYGLYILITGHSCFKGKVL